MRSFRPSFSFSDGGRREWGGGQDMRPSCRPESSCCCRIGGCHSAGRDETCRIEAEGTLLESKERDREECFRKGKGIVGKKKDKGRLEKRTGSSKRKKGVYRVGYF